MADPQKQADEKPIIEVRLENEDDDGYDPWSDRCEQEPLFEPDPWD